jgi:tRNA(Ile)-lysidine synthase
LLGELGEMIVHCLESAVEAAWPIHEWQDANVLLAVSGGADSVALLRACAANKARTGGRGQLVVGHFHHGLRGTAADEDLRWVEHLTAQLGIPFLTGQAEEGKLQSRQDGFEAAARQARYQFLTQAADQLGARYVATGHTADDQVETVLHHILRGSGLAGLAGMPRQRPLSPSVSLVRPMLEISRTDVLTYLSDLRQEYRMDATNEDQKFTRNRLRHDLLPAMRSVRPEVDSALLRLAVQAGEAQSWIAAAAIRVAEACVTRESKDHYLVDVRPLRQTSPLLIREVFKSIWEQADWPRQDMGYAEWQMLADLALRQTDRSVLQLPGRIQAECKHLSILLARAQSIS